MSMRVRLMAVLAVAALLVGGGGWWWLSRPPEGPLPPPAAPWPTTGTVAAFLCDEQSASPSCDGILQTRRDEVGSAMRAMPELSAVRLETRAEAWENILRTGDEELISITRKSEVPESWQARVASPNEELREKLEALPGVFSVKLLRTDFWFGKTELSIDLCASKDCVGRGMATEQEKAAIYDRLSTLEGVEAVYFANGAHTTENLARVHLEVPSKEGLPHPGSFHVKLADPKAADVVRRAVEGLAGVAEVREHRERA